MKSLGNLIRGWIINENNYKTDALESDIDKESL